jgi:hypothetical protein
MLPLLIVNLLLSCIMLLTECANSGNLKGNLVLLSPIPLRDQVYLTAAASHESLVPLRDQLNLTAAGLSLSLISRDQPCQLAVNLSTSLISRDQLCLLALHLSSQGVC